MNETREIEPNEDPVCGMTVDVERARSSDLTHEHDGREYVFCGKGCMLDFRDDPARYLNQHYLPMM
jgi:YHS domain-containing protein